MNETHEMVTVHEEEMYGDNGHIGLRIQLAYPRKITQDERPIFYEAARTILQRLYVNTCLRDPKKQAEKDEMVKKFRQCFMDAGWGVIFIEEMPNQYSNNDYPHIPWLSVTTKAGHFVLGWRKRVIELRWTDTRIKVSAAEMFPQEDVTKGTHMIHAWGYEKLTEYLRILFLHWDQLGPIV